MKEYFLTKEGVLTESVSKVYLSDDKLYHHPSNNVVNIYNVLKIKDIDKMFEKEIVINGNKFRYPEIDGYGYEEGFPNVTYTYVDNSDIYVSFNITSETTKENYMLNPLYTMYNRVSELYESISEEMMKYY